MYWTLSVFSALFLRIFFVDRAVSDGFIKKRIFSGGKIENLAVGVFHHCDHSRLALSVVPVRT